ncbi:MAG TPA: septal ring lytic transglycosylase RlpA family protein, partial [Gammaproteobacteria bacterium]|nr:septal ring lytic transglycosylase RlpA family protein [Gammaproteobacteria bacterium]
MPTTKAAPDTPAGRQWPAAIVLLATVLTACTTAQNHGRYARAQDSGPDRAVDVSGVPDAVPREEPRSRYGNPASYVVNGKRYYTLSSARGYRERGIASWYGSKFHGHRTSSGEPYDMYRMSAAHKTLPLPSYARVTNLDNGKSVIVKINDRGPFHENRLIDLSYAAAARLGILGKGTGLVELEVIDPAEYRRQQARPAVMASRPKHTAAAKAPTATPPSLYLQVGAFSKRDNAERLQARLRKAAIRQPLHISEAWSRDRHLYRVRIGPLPSVESADRLTRLLTDQGIA